MQLSTQERGVDVADHDTEIGLSGWVDVHPLADFQRPESWNRP
jgi:hypothetical protein